MSNDKIEIDDEDIVKVKINYSYVDLYISQEFSDNFVCLYRDELINVAKAMGITPEDLKE